MPYCMRLFTKNDEFVAIERLLFPFGQLVQHKLYEGTVDDWVRLGIETPEGAGICTIGRYRVLPGSIGEDECDGFIEEHDTALPRSAATWVQASLKDCRCTYLCDVHAASDDAAWGPYRPR